MDNYLTSVAAALGVFLLSISLLEWGAGYGAKAEALHRNAEQLNAFKLKMMQIIAQSEAGKALSDKEIDDLRIEYEEIKEKCSTNHLPIDDALFRAHHHSSKEFLKEDGTRSILPFYALLINIRWHLSEIWFFGAIWLIVILLTVFLFYIPSK